MSFFKKTDYSVLMNDGAQIVDVRTPMEYASGAIKDSLNLPLDHLRSELSQLDPEKPVITCCATGMRSGLAKTILKNNGFKFVYNGGSWGSLKRKLK